MAQYVTKRYVARDFNCFLIHQIRRFHKNNRRIVCQLHDSEVITLTNFLSHMKQEHQWNYISDSILCICKERFDVSTVQANAKFFEHLFRCAGMEDVLTPRTMDLLNPFLNDDRMCLKVGTASTVVSTSRKSRVPKNRAPENRCSCSHSCPVAEENKKLKAELEEANDEIKSLESELDDVKWEMQQLRVKARRYEDMDFDMDSDADFDPEYYCYVKSVDRICSMK